MTSTPKAALWMVGALVSFLTMGISGRELSAELTTAQILTYRSFVGLLIISAILSRMGWGQVKTQQPGLQAFRNAVHLFGQYGWFAGIAALPLAKVFAIEFTVPLWTALIAPFFLGEKLTLRRFFAVAIGFVGILIILRPGLVPISGVSLLVLAAAVGYALAHMSTKKLTRTDTALAILFFMTVTQFPVVLGISLYEGWVWPSVALWPWVAVVGITALSAHYCLTNALKVADAIVVVPMDFLRVPAVAVVGLLVYGEVLDVYVLLGALVIFAGNFLNIWGEQRRV